MKGEYLHLREKGRRTFSKQFELYRNEGNNYLQSMGMHVSKLEAS